MLCNCNNHNKERRGKNRRRKGVSREGVLAAEVWRTRKEEEMGVKEVEMEGGWCLTISPG